MDASDLNMSNVSESAGLIATVDALFGIIRTPVMMAEGCYYLKAIALRNSQHMGDKKRFNMEQNYLRIEEDMTEDIIPENMDIPALMTSANKYAAAKINSHGGFQTPGAPQAASQPQLGLTESQLNGKALFGI